ncbi:MAG TPA: DUF3488 and transglutaminase-like domain-containing protein, partial [Xanthomonadaceae bacterium]|nr:DUF3488 and transglutaminase-like domain-containing protein [Xanthomonadaceae bacterium]
RPGRDTASALLLAMLMLKPVELNTLRDARSLIGFALFALFAALLLDQGPLTLALALPAAVLAFGACARMADAEVGLTSGGLDWRRVLVILGLFALATPLALTGFWLFPRLGSPLWGLPDVARAKVGIGDNMAPGDWLDLLVDDTPAFRVRFDGPAPAQESLYWRGIVMWNFDGRAWKQADWPLGYKPASVTGSGRPIHYQITLEPTDKRYLFALDLPRSTPDDAHMAEDLSLTAEQPVNSLRAYTLTSATPARFEADLDPRIRAVALRLPPGYNPRTIALARQWRAQTTDDEQIVGRALAMYRKSFSYSLAAPPLGRDSVDEFLFGTKIGFCEHFSSSFTFLMRAAGIPARVVTGYVGGYQNRIGDFLLVRQSDAHAWSEVWLRGRGWTRVDPTAAVAPERVFRHAAQNTLGPGGGTTMDQLFDAGDWLRNGWNDFVLGFDAARQLSLLDTLGLHDADSRTLVIVFATVMVVLLLAVGVFQLRDRGPRADPLLRAWLRFTMRLERAHLRKQAHEPALAYARRIAALLPAQGDAILSLSQRFANARYARQELDDQGRRALIQALRAFRVIHSSRP